MWMTSYIREIQRQLTAVYGFKEDPAQPGIPLDVPDGEYPMIIEGKFDRVRIEDGKISCMNLIPSNSSAGSEMPYLVSTATLRSVIESSEARPTHKRALIAVLEAAGVFKEPAIGSLQLGILLSCLSGSPALPREPSANVVLSAISDLNKLPWVRLFHLGELITVAGGQTIDDAPFLASEGQDGLRDLISYMTNAGMMTETAVHTLKHVCRKGLLEQHPWLAEIDVSVVTTKNHESWLADQVAKYGERHPVAPLVNTEDTTVSVSDVHRRDAKRMSPGRTSPLLKTTPIKLSDVGKYLVVSPDGQSAQIVTGEEFAKIGVDEFDSWSDIGEFDVNQW